MKQTVLIDFPKSISSDKLFNCEKCDFVAETNSDIVKHRTEIYNWSSFYFQLQQPGKIKRTDPH